MSVKIIQVKPSKSRNRWFLVGSFVEKVFHHGCFGQSGCRSQLHEGQGFFCCLSITNPPDTKSLEVFDYDNSEMHSSIGLGTLCHQFGHLGDITVGFEFCSERC
jgi:hypothetical protein